MPTYRKLHTKTIDSLDVASMSSDFVRLTWVLLPLVSCRLGRGMVHAGWLKSKLHPLRDDVAGADAMSAINEFHILGLVEFYSVNGRKYYEIKNWHKYQGNTTKEAASDYPDPVENDDSLLQSDLLLTSSGAGQEQRPTNSVTDSVFSIQYSDADVDSISEESEIEKPIDELVEVFKSEFGILLTPHPTTNEWRDNWQPYLQALLDQHGSDSAGLIRAAKVAKSSAEKSAGKTFAVKSPKSINAWLGEAIQALSDEPHVPEIVLAPDGSY